MIILRNTSKLLAWHHDVLARCLLVTPGRTVGLVTINVLNRVLTTLAFFLPLKIILLVGGPGIPRYFRAFIEPADKDAWVVGLTAAAILAYILTLFLDRLSDRLAHDAGAAFGDNGLTVAVHSDRPANAERLVARVCEAYGDILFVSVAITLGLLVNAPLFALVLGLLVAEGIGLGVLVNSMLQEGDSRTDVLARHWPGWAGIFTSANFLLAFAALLGQFLLFGYDNILLAILSVLLLRQMFGALSRYGQNGLWLWTWRDQIQALIMAEDTGALAPAKRVSRLDTLFNTKVRKKRMVERLERELGIRPQLISYRWLDPRRRQVLTFLIQVRVGESGGVRNLFERVHIPARQRRVKRELLLEEAMPEGSLPRVPVLSRETFNGVMSTLSDLGDSLPLETEEAKVPRVRLLLELWRTRPSEALLSGWQRSRGSLAQRLSPEWLTRMELAAETARGRRQLATLLGRFEEMVSWIRAVPLFVYNPVLRCHNMCLDPDGRPLLLEWGDWAVEPVGLGLRQLGEFGENPQRLAEECSICLSDGTPLTGDHLRLVADVAELETLIRQLMLRQALEKVPDILDTMDRLALGAKHHGTSVGA